MRTREELESMTIRQLRLIDIRDKEEEEIVQEILNKRLAAKRPEVKINRSDAPDIKTPEQEAAYQKVLDEREARIKGRLLGTEAPQTPSDVSNSEVNSPIDNTPMVDHVLDQEDLDENPELVAEGLKVGDVVRIPAEDKDEDEGKPTDSPGENGVKPLQKMNKAELVEYALSIGLEFDVDVKNNVQRIKAIKAKLG